MTLLEVNTEHLITLPDGTVYSDTVYLKTVIEHPRIEAAHEDRILDIVRPERRDRAKDYAVVHGCYIFDVLDEAAREKVAISTKEAEAFRAYIKAVRRGAKHPPIRSSAEFGTLKTSH